MAGALLVECLECGVRVAEWEQSCARCGAPLPRPAPALLTRSAIGASPVRVRKVRLAPPVAPGFYPDPGGKAAIREWTGTEWSPFLRDYPAGHGRAAGSDPAVWSPLSPDVQQKQWDLAISASHDSLVLITVALACALMMAFCTVLVAAADPDPNAPVVIGMFALFTVACLVPAAIMIRNRPTRRRIAEAAGEAHALASAQDNPAPPKAT